MGRKLVVGLGVFVSSVWAASASANVMATPSSVTLVQGEASDAIGITVAYSFLTITTGYVDLTGLPPGATGLPARPAYTTHPDTGLGHTQFSLATSLSTPVGTYPIFVTDSSFGAGSTTVMLTVLPRVDLSLSVNPTAVSVIRGRTSAPLTVRVTHPVIRSEVSVPTGSLQVTGLPAGATTLPSALTYPIPANGTEATTLFQIAATSAVVPGRYVLTVSDATLHAGSATVVLTVLSDPPTITAVSPSVVPTAAPSVPVHVVGTSFDLAGHVVVEGRGVVVLSSRVISSTLAEATLALRDDAPPGPREIRVVNPDGQATNPAGRFVVLAGNPLAGALVVTRLATLSPQPGTALSPQDRVHAKGVLVVTGAGTLIGSWLLDGVPFDRFTAYAVGGDPVEVASAVPIPALVAGEHRLELAIDLPQRLVSTPLTLVGVAESRTSLKLLAPAEGRLLLREPLPTFRWTLVPGALGYEVEIDGARRYQVTDSEWTPGPAQWTGMADGEHRWCVRARFLGDVRGETSLQRGFNLLPAHVEVGGIRTQREARTGRSVLHWTGGPAGMVYKIELFESRAKTPAFQALTRKTSYAFPPSAGYGRQRASVRITALGPGGLSLGASEIVATTVSDLGRDGWGFAFAQLTTPAAVTRLEPVDGGSTTETQPLIEAEWTGTVARTEVGLTVDNIDATEAATWTASSLMYPSALPLAPGVHTVTLRLGEQARTWSFTVAAPEAASVAPGDQAAQPPRRDWGLTAQATVAKWDIPDGAASNVTAGTLALPPADVARLQVGLQADLAERFYALKATGDAAARYDLADPTRAVSENRNWLVNGSATRGSSRGVAQIGYGTPALADQSEIVTTGLPRLGLELRAAQAAVGVSAYSSFDSGGAGLAGIGALDQTVRAASVQIGREGGSALLRASAIGVETQPGQLSAGGKGALYGVLGRVVLGTGATVVAEGGYGSSKPSFAPSAYTDPSGQLLMQAPESKGGVSWRMNLTGMARQTAYAFTVRKSDADFSNPANAGFTTGSVGNMFSSDLMLNRAFSGGRVAASLMARHAESAVAAASDAPKIKDENLMLSLMLGGGKRVSLMLAGNGLLRRGDAYDSYGMPKTDSRSVSGSATLTQTIATLVLSQMFTYQSTSDRVNEYGSAKTYMGLLSANGAVGQHLTLSLSANAMRNEAGAAFGSTDMLTLSAQPIVQVQRLALTVTPSLTYSKMKNALAGVDTATEQYGGTLSWTPRWLRSLATLQLLSDWSRVRSQGVDAHFARRVAGVLVVRFSTGKGATLSPSTRTTPAAPASPAVPGMPVGQSVASGRGGAPGPWGLNTCLIPGCAQGAPSETPLW